MPKAIFAVILSVLLLALAIAGCGGGDDSSDSANGSQSAAKTSDGESGGGEEGESGEESKPPLEGGSLTRAAFIKQADARCNAINSEQSTMLEAFGKENKIKPGVSPTERQEEIILEVALPNVRKNIEQLDEMEPPSGDEGELQAIVDANEKALDEIEIDPSEIVQTGYTKIAVFAEGTKLSMAYGFKVCGQY